MKTNLSVKYKTFRLLFIAQIASFTFLILLIYSNSFNTNFIIFFIYELHDNIEHPTLFLAHSGLFANHFSFSGCSEYGFFKS
jgi:hypothetical protein